MGAPVVEWQLLTPDPDASAQFLETAFGWTADRDNRLGYRRIAAEASGVAGGLWPAPPEAGAMIQLFVAVPDVEAALASATAAGASVLIPRQVLPDGDELAVIVGPDGISWGLTRRS